MILSYSFYYAIAWKIVNFITIVVKVSINKTLDFLLVTDLTHSNLKQK
jgi:hypothetical protein